MFYYESRSILFSTILKSSLCFLSPKFCKFETYATSDWYAKPKGWAKQKLCFSQIPLNVEKSGEQDWERF